MVYRAAKKSAQITPSMITVARSIVTTLNVRPTMAQASRWQRRRLRKYSQYDVPSPSRPRGKRTGRQRMVVIIKAPLPRPSSTTTSGSKQQLDAARAVHKPIKPSLSCSFDISPPPPKALLTLLTESLHLGVDSRVKGKKASLYNNARSSSRGGQPRPILT